MNKIWFITGSSRGLGRALTEAVLASGDTVVATARRPEQLNDLAARFGSRLDPVALDVTSPAQAQAAVAAAFKAHGRIDVLVNNAGYGFTGALEEMTPDEFKGQIDTNFWGVVNVTRAALPFLRRQRAGHIIQITSIGGRFAVPGFTGYHAAKFAVEGLSEALAQEIAPLGIKLTIVEPGGFRTDWAGSSMASAQPIEDYNPTVGFMRAFLAANAHSMPGDPKKAATAIIEIAKHPAPPLRLPLGNDAMALLRSGYQRNLDELDRWAEVTHSTDFDDAQVSSTRHEILKVLSPA